MSEDNKVNEGYKIDKDRVAESLQEVVALLIQHNNVEIFMTEGEESVFFEVIVPNEDVGKVIGRDGTTVTAIRKLYGSIMAQEKLRVNLSVIGKNSKNE